MLRLLQLIFFGHVHKWKILNEVPLQRWPGRIGEGKPWTGTNYILRCEDCGKLKQFDTV